MITADSLTILVLVMLIAALFHFLPLWHRQSLWFGVTVGPDFSATPEAARILRRYRVEMWTFSAVAWILAWAGLLSGYAWMLAGGPLLQSLGACLAFALGRNRTRPFARHETGSRAASLAAAPESLPGGPAGIAGPYAILAAAAIFLRVNWQSLPARFPVHWGIHGNPDRWARRTWASVYSVLIIGGLAILLLHIMGYLIVSASPRSRMAETAGWTARFRRANLRLIVVLGWMLAAMFAAIALNPYLAPGGAMAVPVWIMIAAVLVVSAALIWPIIRICQEPGSGSDGTPDECWKLGQIYYNPNDPALLVEKRFGVGYTINFGNRASWLVVALILLMVLVPVMLRGGRH